MTAGGPREESAGAQMYFAIVSASGGYRVRIRGNNRETMFLSEVYTTKASAKHAIAVVKAGAANASVVDVT